MVLNTGAYVVGEFESAPDAESVISFISPPSCISDFGLIIKELLS